MGADRCWMNRAASVCGLALVLLATNAFAAPRSVEVAVAPVIAHTGFGPWPIQRGSELAAGFDWQAGSVLFGPRLSFMGLLPSEVSPEMIGGPSMLLTTTWVVGRVWRPGQYVRLAALVEAGLGWTLACHGVMLCGETGSMLGASASMDFRIAGHWWLGLDAGLREFEDDGRSGKSLVRVALRVSRTFDDGETAGSPGRSQGWLFGVGPSVGLDLGSPAPGLMIGLQEFVGRAWLLGQSLSLRLLVTLRQYLYGRGPQMQGDLGFELRRRVLGDDERSLELGGSAGYGLWMGCIRGGYCGGTGPRMGGVVALRQRRADGGFLGVALSLSAQTGLVNDVRMLYLPALLVEFGQ